MNKIKFGAFAAATLLLVMPDVQAQNYTQRGTRNGAIAGAILGGIVGARRDRPIAGAALGGLIGGVAGRAIGNSQDRRFYGGGQGHGFQNFTPAPRHPGIRYGHSGYRLPPFHVQPPVARPGHGRGFYGGGHGRHPASNRGGHYRGW